ncbi:MAG TPA: hypothetical protein VGQ53_08520 [Chitinophagaceae bacterium]|jgi:ATP-dependent Zn protease|nr:hypothetical protein [Chitinophagaceae bacterium]
MTLHLLYIDPGTGSYLVQVIVAGALGIAFFFKNIGRFFKNAWWYVRSLFTRSQKDNS